MALYILLAPGVKVRITPARRAVGDRPAGRPAAPRRGQCRREHRGRAGVGLPRAPPTAPPVEHEYEPGLLRPDFQLIRKMAADPTRPSRSSSLSTSSVVTGCLVRESTICWTHAHTACGSRPI